MRLSESPFLNFLARVSAGGAHFFLIFLDVRFLFFFCVLRSGRHSIGFGRQFWSILRSWGPGNISMDPFRSIFCIFLDFDFWILWNFAILQALLWGVHPPEGHFLEKWHLLDFTSFTMGGSTLRGVIFLKNDTFVVRWGLKMEYGIASAVPWQALSWAISAQHSWQRQLHWRLW